MEPGPSVCANRMLLYTLDDLPFHRSASSPGLPGNSTDSQLLSHLSGNRDFRVRDRVGLPFWMGWSALVQRSTHNSVRGASRGAHRRVSDVFKEGLGFSYINIGGVLEYLGRVLLYTCFLGVDSNKH